MKKIDRWTKKLNDPPIEGIHGLIYGRANYLKSEGLSQNEAVEIIKLKVKTNTQEYPIIIGSDIVSNISKITKDNFLILSGGNIEIKIRQNNEIQQYIKCLVRKK